MAKRPVSEKKKKAIKKRKVVVEAEEEPAVPPISRSSEDPIPKKVKWTNKQRVLVFGTRGISYRDRHLMEDLKMLLPHSKPDSKMEKKDSFFVVNEICDMKNCNKCILFEGRKKRDLYMWISNTPQGPSCKFLVQSVFTMGELKLTGNCLKGSRPLLSFDEHFSSKPHLALMKELIVQTFSTPYHHPKSQPFIDHVFTFSYLDGRIWFRNYQIVEEDGSLAEVGPRFVLFPIKIFEGSFGGQTLWEEPNFVSPAKIRRQLKLSSSTKYISRVHQKIAQEESKPAVSYNLKPLDDIFSKDVDEVLKNDEIQPEPEEIAVIPPKKVKKKLKPTVLAKKGVHQTKIKKQKASSKKDKGKKFNNGKKRKNT
ncbi:ribosome biogenesis protein BRX1 homolog [Ischnura elegans]|uniref:ribosome biogenesis protein BRX1 homolog n=1 Tax=Ischnura elegans TaxID=197161 RepID=UPI001ED89585|nr:ribosome biogenesis protein BRX1 homolog [Ischnura elegans]